MSEYSCQSEKCAAVPPDTCICSALTDHHNQKGTETPLCDEQEGVQKGPSLLNRYVKKSLLAEMPTVKETEIITYSVKKTLISTLVGLFLGIFNRQVSFTF